MIAHQKFKLLLSVEELSDHNYKFTATARKRARGGSLMLVPSNSFPNLTHSNLFSPAFFKGPLPLRFDEFVSLSTYDAVILILQP